MFIHEGRGLLNKFINRLPITRGDPGINPLDAACKEHDIAYSQNRENVEARNAADRVLAQKAWQRVWSKVWTKKLPLTLQQTPWYGVKEEEETRYGSEKTRHHAVQDRESGHEIDWE